MSRALIFIAHEESSSGTPTVTSVTYGGQTMDKIIEITSDTSGSNYRNYVAAFILDDAGIDDATSSDFSVTWSASTSAVGYASVFLQNVDQTDTVGASDSTQTGSGTDPISTSALATSDGDMVIDAATCGNAGSYTLTGFTEGYDESTGGSGLTGAAGYVSATSANVTPTANYDSYVNRQALIGFVVHAAPTGIYQNCAQVQAGGYGLVSDLTGDCYVDLWDLEKIAFYWLYTNCGSYGDCEGADFEPDSDVDLIDFSDFAVDWLLCNDPGDSNCIKNW